MSEKKFRQVCKCENCGNEAEMMITCSLVEVEKKTEHRVDPPKGKVKGQAVCTHCGNESDIWVDL